MTLKEYKDAVAKQVKGRVPTGFMARVSTKRFIEANFKKKLPPSLASARIMQMAKG